jgi:hypothetical protein
VFSPPPSRFRRWSLGEAFQRQRWARELTDASVSGRTRACHPLSPLSTPQLRSSPTSVAITSNNNAIADLQTVADASSTPYRPLASRFCGGSAVLHQHQASGITLHHRSDRAHTLSPIHLSSTVTPHQPPSCSRRCSKPS